MLKCVAKHLYKAALIEDLLMEETHDQVKIDFDALERDPKSIIRRGFKPEEMHHRSRLPINQQIRDMMNSILARRSIELSRC